jgi:TRAP-type C4-dicarboxylate transport system permease small subunit
MSAHGFELPGSTPPEDKIGGPLGVAEGALELINKVIMMLASIALIAASLILSYSVVVRYYFKAPTYWQDEASVFLLVGATFLTAAHVQSKRGHVGIDALVGFLSPAANHLRVLLVDCASFAFCTFFSWKSWTLFHEAWEDGQVTSSTWAPPLWIPYSVMAAGMTLLCIQIALQIAVSLHKGQRS